MTQSEKDQLALLLAQAPQCPTEGVPALLAQITNLDTSLGAILDYYKTRFKTTPEDQKHILTADTEKKICSRLFSLGVKAMSLPPALGEPPYLYSEVLTRIIFNYINT